MMANAMAVMVALAKGGNQSAARPVMCFQVISLLMVATGRSVRLESVKSRGAAKAIAKPTIAWQWLPRSCHSVPWRRLARHCR